MSTTTTTTTSRNATVYPGNSEEGELPILVGLLAIGIGLFGVFFLVVGLLLTATGLGILGLPAVGAYAVISGGALFAGLITLIFGAVLITVATGLWDTEMWALVVTAIVVGAVIVLLVAASSFGWILLIAVVLLIYLIAVHRHFY